MSDNMLPPQENRDLDDPLKLLHDDRLDWHLDSEMMDAIEHFAEPLEGEDEFKKLLKAKLATSLLQGGPQSTLGKYIAQARGGRSLKDLGKILGISPMFLRELESNQIGRQGIVKAFAPQKMAQMIVELKLDVERVVGLLKAHVSIPAGPTLSRTSSDLKTRDRSHLQIEVESSQTVSTVQDDNELLRYLDALRAEVKRQSKT